MFLQNEDKCFIDKSAPQFFEGTSSTCCQMKRTELGAKLLPTEYSHTCIAEMQPGYNCFGNQNQNQI